MRSFLILEIVEQKEFIENVRLEQRLDRDEGISHQISRNKF